MQTISAVFAYTFKEHARHKAWMTSALFGLVLLGGALIVSALGADERARLLLDLGLAAIEAIALISIVFMTPLYSLMAALAASCGASRRRCSRGTR